MAVAGDTKNAFFLRLDGKHLNVIGQHRVIKSLIEHDVDKAVVKLRSGKSIYLLAYGDNLARVKETFAEAK